MPYPKLCELCEKQIEDEYDLDWHGYGNCVEITDEMWEQWKREAEENVSNVERKIRSPKPH